MTLTIITVVCTRCPAGWEVEGVNLEIDETPRCPVCGRTDRVEPRGERKAVPLST